MKFFERSNGLDTALYKHTFTFLILVNSCDDIIMGRTRSVDISLIGVSRFCISFPSNH